MYRPELLSKLSQHEMSRRTFGLVMSGSAAPSSLVGSALDSSFGRKATYFAGGIISDDPNREIRRFTGEVDFPRFEEIPFLFHYEAKPVGEFFTTKEKGKVGDGVIKTQGDEFIVARFTGKNDPLFSSPFYDITCTSEGFQEHSRIGIMQGPHSRTSVTRLGLLPEGEYHIEVDTTEFTGNDDLQKPAVDFFAITFTHPLMSRLVIPLLGSYAQKYYHDSDPGIGFREDAPALSKVDIYEREDVRFAKVNKYNIKERRGHINRLLHSRIAPYDIDLAQVAEGLSDGSCQRVGFVTDWSLSLGSLIFDVRKHHVVVTNEFPEGQFLDENGFVPPLLQETGKHGLLTDKMTADIFYKPMPTFPGATWPDFGFAVALGVTSWRQTIASGQVDTDDSRVVSFAKKYLDGRIELLIHPDYIYR